jgi:prepilin-type N-terminal cleavage/methylation domain-containing protein
MLKAKNKGFTLIELLVVIAIIGLLAAVTLVSLNRARMKVRDTRRIADIKQLFTALQLYYNANGSLPNCFDPGYVGGCDITGFGPYTGLADGSGDEQFVTFLQTAGLIDAIPLDPVNSPTRLYVYGRGEFPSGSGNFYNIFIGAFLEDPNNPALVNDFDIGLSGLESFYMLADRR